MVRMWSQIKRFATNVEVAKFSISVLYGTCVFTRAVTGKNQGLSMTNTFFKDFQGLEFREKIQGLLRMRGNPVTRVIPPIYRGHSAIVRMLLHRRKLHE